MQAPPNSSTQHPTTRRLLGPRCHQWLSIHLLLLRVSGHGVVPHRACAVQSSDCQVETPTGGMEPPVSHPVRPPCHLSRWVCPLWPWAPEKTAQAILLIDGCFTDRGKTQRPLVGGVTIAACDAAAQFATREPSSCSPHRRTLKPQRGLPRVMCEAHHPRRPSSPPAASMSLCVRGAG
jgi:hypothetical protein